MYTLLLCLPSILGIHSNQLMPCPGSVKCRMYSMASWDETILAAEIFRKHGTIPSPTGKHPNVVANEAAWDVVSFFVL